MSTQVLLREDSEGINMTMPNARNRAVIQTGEFLLEVSEDSSLPGRIRRDATFLPPLYPNPFQRLLAGWIEEASGTDVSPMGLVLSSSTKSSYHCPIILVTEATVPR